MGGGEEEDGGGKSAAVGGEGGGEGEGSGGVSVGEEGVDMAAAERRCPRRTLKKQFFFFFSRYERSHFYSSRTGPALLWNSSQLSVLSVAAMRVWLRSFTHQTACTKSHGKRLTGCLNVMLWFTLVPWC